MFYFVQVLLPQIYALEWVEPFLSYGEEFENDL